MQSNSSKSISLVVLTAAELPDAAPSLGTHAINCLRAMQP